MVDEANEARRLLQTVDNVTNSVVDSRSTPSCNTHYRTKKTIRVELGCNVRKRVDDNSNNNNNNNNNIDNNNNLNSPVSHLSQQVGYRLHRMHRTHRTRRYLPSPPMPAEPGMS